MNDVERKQEHFLSLLDPVYGRLVRYVRAMTHDKEAAKDVVGETILAAYENIDSLRDENSFLCYLISIARRKHRRMWIRQRLFVRIEPHHEDLLPDGSSSTEQLFDIDLLFVQMDKLPKKQKEALTLFELSGLSLEEIRIVQGGSLSGVKSRIIRARKRLAKLLGIEEKRSLAGETSLHVPNEELKLEEQEL